MAFVTGSTIESTAVDSNESINDASGDLRTQQFKNLSSSEQTYTTSNHSKSVRSDSTDEVDIRKLVDEPTIDDIRWLYGQFFASTIVDKPIDDAFKNGFTTQHEPTNSIRPYLEDTEYISNLKVAEKKSRRDGLSLIFRVCEDSSDGLHEPITASNFVSLEELKVLTVDDLSNRKPPRFEELLPPEYQPADGQSLEDVVEVRDSGIVVSRKDGDPSFGDPIGYLMDRRADKGSVAKFVHESRIQHFTWRGEVDGDYTGPGARSKQFTTDKWGSLGKWEGESILMPAYHILKSLFKGDWATMQTLFRYSSPLYEMKLPERADKDDLKKARNNFRNLNAKSDIVTPFGYEVELHETDGQLDPQSFFDPIFEQICASVEMTKSVLFGTQAGVTSGSEVDIQNYFNQVDRYQSGRAEEKIDEHVRWMFARDQETIPSFALGYDLDWHDIFELSELDQAEVLRVHMQSISNAFNDFSISPPEARDLTREAFEKAGFEADIEGELEPEDYDILMELNVAQQGNAQLFPSGPESEMSGNSQMQNGGGMEQGQSTAQANPTRSS